MGDIVLATSTHHNRILQEDIKLMKGYKHSDRLIIEYKREGGRLEKKGSRWGEMGWKII